jgi:catechol 2,3-dioxygenase-like lactoylglutathione lyase family enzyme
MAIDHVFAGVPVTDYAAARAWWERLVGRPPDLIPNDHEAAWQLTETGWIYIDADAGPAGQALITVLVDDLDRHVAELAERGLATEPIDTVAGVVRTARITDPDGNRITFGQAGG